MFDCYHGFYKGKKVLVTGHTGFKGSWLCCLLAMLGADVIGYALEAPTTPNLFTLCGLGKKMKSLHGDVRNFENLLSVFRKERPEMVFHLAAQPIVRESYKNPVLTYETNVMGTVNVCECVRQNPCVRSFLNVTTDKVYENKEWMWGYRETDPLDGYDPYSNSKSCSELVTHSYVHSYFTKSDTAVSTARAGNVIGGGDFATDRILPDCVRAAIGGRDIFVRSPDSIRPYQHVLEALSAYLLIAKNQYEDRKYAGSYNVGPEDIDCITTRELVELFCHYWGEGIHWNRNTLTKELGIAVPHEAGCLKLDCSKLKQTFSWKPRWHVEEAIAKTVAWSKIYQKYQKAKDAKGMDGELAFVGEIQDCMEAQIREFFSALSY